MADALPAGVISGWYGKSVFVEGTPPSGENPWGIQKPPQALEFKYMPADVGAGYIDCNGQRVCGASMTSDGFGRWAVPAATDLPQCFNMTLKNARDCCRYLDNTNNKIYEQTSTIAKELARTEEKVATLSNGIESNGVQEVIARLHAVQSKVQNLEAEVAKGVDAAQKLQSSVEKEEEKLQTSVKKAEEEVMLLTKNLAGQKEALEANAQAKLVTEDQLEKLKSEMDKRHAELDEQVKKKCECVVM